MSDEVRGAAVSRVDDSPSVPASHRRVGGQDDTATAGAVGRRGPLVVCLAVIAVLSFGALCFATSYSSTLNSDGAGFALAGWDMLHGNLLLRHWYMADAPFYSLETPLYGVVESIVGLGATAARLVATLTYMLVAIVAAGLAVQGTSGMRTAYRSSIVALCLASPLCFGGQSYLVLEMPTHLGTAVYLMLAFLVYARWHNTRLAGAVALFAVLVLGQFEDATIPYIGITAIVLVAASCVLQDRRLVLSELRMVVAAVLAYPAALLLRKIALHFGAYALVPPSTRFAPLSALPGNIEGTFKSLLFIYNIYQVSGPGPHTAQQYVAATVGVVALAAGVIGFVLVLVRWRRADRVDRLTCLAAALYLGVFAVSTFAANSATRGYEFIGVIPIFAVLAARNLPEFVRVPTRAATLAVTAAATAVLVTGIVAPVTPGPGAPPPQLAGWLASHGLTQGIAGYWDAAAVTVDSGGKVQVRAVTPGGAHGYQIYLWHTNASWYSPAHADATFFIADPNIAGMGVKDVESAYGTPAKIYSVGGLEVLVYHANLYNSLS